MYPDPPYLAYSPPYPIPTTRVLACSVLHLGKKDISGDANQKDYESKEIKMEHRSSEGVGVEVVLDDSDLWSKFEKLTNEMIVTKNGR